MNNISNNIGSAIRLVRKFKNLSQEDLSKKAKITQGFLSLIEKGRREPSLLLIEKIANILNIPEVAIFILASKKPMTKKTKIEIDAIVLQLLDIHHDYNT